MTKPLSYKRIQCIFCEKVFNAPKSLIESGIPIRCTCQPGAMGGSKLFNGASVWRNAPRKGTGK